MDETLVFGFIPMEFIWVAALVMVIVIVVFLIKGFLEEMRNK